MDLTYFEFSLRLLAGLGAGLIIGIEREIQNKPAGLRTNALVSTGSALFVLLSFNITPDNGDITRIIAQIVTGIGFLGAGIIFKEGSDVFGLTTAATIWCSAAVGCFAGAGYFFETLLAVIVIISINYLLIPVDKWFSKRKNSNNNK